MAGSLTVMPYVFMPDQWKQDLNGLTKGFMNSFSALSMVLQSIYDYEIVLSRYEYNTPEFHAQRSIIHKQVAERILDLSIKCRGVYLKAGQYIGNLDRVMPREFTQTLCVLQDQGPSQPFEKIKVALEYELQQPITEVFSQFDEQAIAAASLAQVHKATLKSNNQLVAVKVQFPELRTQYRYDLVVIHNIARICDFFVKFNKSGEYHFGDLFGNFRDALIKELDFKQEAANGVRTMEYFKQDRHIYVPKYFQVSSRMIIMEFIEGVKINEVVRNPKECAGILIDLFGKMIFEHGHIHCDAHPGNILFRANPQYSNEMQLVLLDHGFYTDIDTDKLQKFRELWISLAFFDYNKTKQVAGYFNLNDEHVELLPLIFFYRTMQSNKKFGEAFTKEEREYLRSKDVVNLEKISGLLRLLPPELMFIIRAANLVGIHNAALGGTTRNRLMIFTKYAMRNTYCTLYYYWYLCKLRLMLFLHENLRRT